MIHDNKLSKSLIEAAEAVLHKKIVEQKYEGITPEKEQEINSYVTKIFADIHDNLNTIHYLQSSHNYNLPKKEIGTIDKILALFDKIKRNKQVSRLPKAIGLDYFMKKLATEAKIHDKDTQNINEEVCEVDFDGEMARSDLLKLAKYSQELLSMISDDSDLEPWVQSKITLAADYIGSVKHYLEYQQTKNPRMY